MMSLATYELAGQAHTKKDEVITLSKVKSTQTELNGHVSMLMKVFRIGAEWGHTERFRETMLTNSMAVCPLYLLYKDHKGWDLSKGPVPPTRPVVGGNIGMNLHLSEIVSEVLDPVIENYEGGCETICTEDLAANLDILNEGNLGWNKETYWNGKQEDCYVACGNCPGNPELELDLCNPELCSCGTPNIGTLPGKIRTTCNLVKKI